MANHSNPVPAVKRHLPGDHVDLPDISVGEDSGLPVLYVANHSNPVPDLRRHLPVDHVDLPDILVGEDAGFTALDVVNHSNPVPDVWRHLLGVHLKAVSPTLSQDTALKEWLYIFCTMARRRMRAPGHTPYIHPCHTGAHTQPSEKDGDRNQKA